VTLTTGALTLARKVPIVGALVDLLPLARSEAETERSGGRPGGS
jgi:hypothetical protein